MKIMVSVESKKPQTVTAKDMDYNRIYHRKDFPGCAYVRLTSTFLLLVTSNAIQAVLVTDYVAQDFELCSRGTEIVLVQE